MKSLIAGLLIIAAVCSYARAASTDTVQQSGVDVMGINFRSITDVPVEFKTVEIHMTRAEAPVEQESKRKNRRTELMPLPGHGTCSGAFIDETGDLLTARHCVDGFAEFQVQTYDHQIYTAVVVATSAAHDLAMLRIDRRNTGYFELADRVFRGQQVFVLGSPLGITDTLSEGVIARIDGDVTLLDCSALPGNSGGPVFDKYDRLVGILTAGYTVGFGVTHLNMAQGLDAVHFFIKDALEKRHGR